MTTPLIVTGFEYGCNPTVSGGGLVNSVWGTAGVNYAIESTIKRTGSYSLKCAPTASVRGCVGWNITSGTKGVVRFYIYIGTGPSSGLADIAHFNGSSGDYLCLGLQQSTGKFVIHTFAGQSVLATGPSYVTGQWYLVDLYYDIQASQCVLKCTIDGGTEFTGTFTQTVASTSSFRLGNDGTSGPAYTAYYDDVIISVTSADYPIGAGAVERLKPSADGTHSAGTVIKNTGGTVIDGTVGKTAYTEVDEADMSSTADYVQQTGTGANYAEVVFPDTSQTSIVGAMARLAYMSAGTQSNGAGCAVIDEDATETAIWGKGGATADYSESSIFHKSTILPVPAGGWDQGAVNALKIRMGYGASDVNPVPQWHGLLIEVAYVPASGSTTPMTVTGSVSSAGALGKQDNKPLAGVIASAGTAVKRAAKTLTGGITTAGAVVRRWIGTLAGAVASAGAFAKSISFSRTLTGSVGSAGNLVRSGSKTLAGSAASSGSAAKQAAKTLAGSAASAGAIGTFKVLLRLFEGAMASSGALQRQAKKTLVGAAASAAVSIKQVRKTVAGSAASAGSLTSIKAIVRLFAGAVASAGSLQRQAKKTLAGSAVSAGAAIKQIAKIVTGSAALAGALIRTAGKSLAGAVASAGTAAAEKLAGTIAQTFTGAIAAAGALERRASKTLGGSIASAGALGAVRAVFKLLDGSIGTAGSLGKVAQLGLQGAAVSAGSLAKSISMAFAGLVSTLGSLVAQYVSGTCPVGRVAISDQAAYLTAIDDSPSVTLLVSDTPASTSTVTADDAQAVNLLISDAPATNSTISEG